MPDGGATTLEISCQALCRTLVTNNGLQQESVDISKSVLYTSLMGLLLVADKEGEISLDLGSGQIGLLNVGNTRSLRCWQTCGTPMDLIPLCILESSTTSLKNLYLTSLAIGEIPFLSLVPVSLPETTWSILFPGMSCIILYLCKFGAFNYEFIQLSCQHVSVCLVISVNRMHRSSSASYWTGCTLK